MGPKYSYASVLSSSRLAPFLTPPHFSPCYSRSIGYPTNLARLETTSTYIDDLCIATEPRRYRFPQIQGLPRRQLTQVFADEPDEDHPQRPVLIMAACGIIPYNDRRLFVEPEVEIYLSSRRPAASERVTLTQATVLRPVIQRAKLNKKLKYALMRCAFRNTSRRKRKSRASDLRSTRAPSR
ncbi:hypothetical protein EDB85DRAFT_1956497 [Lactarius pseudohatsudake]|nr:hypothetical protein EDB85DRAFT_1956497 [Lactarius pseudohatsudake]